MFLKMYIKKKSSVNTSVDLIIRTFPFKVVGNPRANKSKARLEIPCLRGLCVWVDLIKFVLIGSEYRGRVGGWPRVECV